uniref:Uncharacterized protein n=1 Tax=Candidatus Kentrum sp. DK TaxID=2126562 RepID=A0A450SQP4_9GAMM|nr:MAG: hypothetical protein BECKDK2373B_GA0170837_105729 [Candidatus Kentron sp. DK]
MEQSLLEKIKADKLAALSTLGSIASIAALTIVILGSVANENIPAQLLGWRIIFFLISLFGISGSALFVFYWARSAHPDKSRSDHGRIWAITWRSIVGLFFVGVFVDALFAAVYWTPWMYGFVYLFRQLGSMYY